MSSEPDMTRNGTGLVRQAGERLVAVLLALLLALSYPAASVGFDLSATPQASSAQLSLAPFTTPDAFLVIPAAETASEPDRSKAGFLSACFMAPFTPPLCIATGAGVLHAALETKTICPATSLPPGCGPPLIS